MNTGSYTVRTNTSNMLKVDYDNSKLCLGENRYINGVMTASGADIDLVGGELVGRVAATGAIVLLTSAAVDGSQYPVGIIAEGQTIVDGTTATVSIVNKGKVDEGMVIFQGGDTLDTIVDGIQLRDRIASDNLGIELIASDELTGFDN